MYNGHIITMAKDHDTVEAVAIADGRLLEVGSSRDIKKKYIGTQRIDLKNRTVIPGIIEGHVHPVGASMSEHYREIPDLHTIEELLNWVQDQAKRRNVGDWIVHPKFFATRLEEMRQPTLQELDAVSPSHPVFLNGSYGGMINSAAIRASGISRTTDDNGLIRDPASGELNGMIRRSAFKLLAIRSEPKLTPAEQLSDLRNLLHLYNKVGITSICVGSGNTEDLNLFKSLRDDSILSVRVFQNISIPFSPGDSMNHMREALAHLGYHTGDGDEWVKVGALKAVIDGGILTGTAFLREPWGMGGKEIYGITDPKYRGVLLISKGELVRMIKVAHEEDWKFTSHVTGGGGVDTLLSAFEEVAKTHSIIDRRFSVIHGNFYTPEAIQKMSALGIFADMQPAWFFKDADLLFKVLGQKRMRTFHPYKSLYDANVVVNGGSDHMVKLNSYTAINPYNPFLSMWSLVTRRSERGSTYFPREALTRYEALAMYTINNAYASFEEELKGSIEPGKLADLAILSEDYLRCPEDSIKEIRVLMTIVGGKIVFQDHAQDLF